MKEYLIEENGRKAFYSNKADAGNKISQNSLDKITDKEDNEFLTYGNGKISNFRLKNSGWGNKSSKLLLGWCDKNVYRSWNKCAVSGKCYTTCSDGNCYEEVKNSSEEIKVLFINIFTSQWKLKSFDENMLPLTPMLKLAFRTSISFFERKWKPISGTQILLTSMAPSSRWVCSHETSTIPVFDSGRL